MIMITGGGGLIGSNLAVEFARHRGRVIIVDLAREPVYPFLLEKSESRLGSRILQIEANVLDLNSLLEVTKKYGVIGMVHAAAVSLIPEAKSDPQRAIAVNVMGTANALEVSRRLDLKSFVYISSSSVYGNPKYTPMDEEHPLEPLDIYGGTKLAGEELALSYRRTYWLNVRIVRPTNVYGPGETNDRVVKTFVENALTGKPLQLKGGEQHRDFTYVLDAVRGIRLAFECEEAVGEVFNISSGEHHSLRELAELVCGYIPDARVEIVPGRELGISYRYLDTRKAERVLGYKPRYSLESGIGEYIKWVTERYAPARGLQIVSKPDYARLRR